MSSPNRGDDPPPPGCIWLMVTYACRATRRPGSAKGGPARHALARTSASLMRMASSPSPAPSDRASAGGIMQAQ